MKYIESPEVYKGEKKSLFLAGGITNCPDWQELMRKALINTDIVLLNPRRYDFPIGDPNAAKAQIKWEFDHLRKASMILFWFPCETLCPIVLYELGSWSITDKKLFVGVHPEYKRRQDVEIQTKLVRPFVKIVYDLESLSNQIKKEIKAGGEMKDVALEEGMRKKGGRNPKPSTLRPNPPKPMRTKKK